MKDGIAIVGMACVFPGAGDLATYWRNLCRGVDAIIDVPPTRWDSVFYDPESRSADRLYCRRGGFVDDFARFDPLEFGVMPVAAESAEPDQMLALATASRALADAGIECGGNGGGSRRGAVILGRGGYLGSGMVRLAEYVRVAQQLVDCLKVLHPDIGEDRLARVRQEFQATQGSFGPEAALGLVPNLVASRIANRLDFHGAAYTVDAACASSLVAVDQACGELQRDRCDLAIAGGVHLCHDVTFWSVFSQLGALSRKQQIRPFDRGADGLLIGEGIGMVVMKRLADARKQGDRIYAVIRGSGVSSDGRGTSLVQPRVEGQVAAMEAAWRDAGLEPDTLGLLEAHGTGTPAGDEAELTSLGRFFGRDLPGLPGIGSVKSMIGHAMPAAGAAGLIKSALSVYHGVRPPTLHCDDPHPLIAETGFRLLEACEDWDRNGVPRRAGVNAFGFGGINAHVVLDGPDGAKVRPAAVTAARPEISVGPDEHETTLRLAADTPGELVRRLENGSVGEPGRGPCRVVVHDPTPERLARALKVVRRGAAWRGRGGIWYAPEGLLSGGGKIAFVFPGVDASFRPRVEDVARHFDWPTPPHATQRDVDMEDIEQVGVGIIGVNHLLHRALGELGIRPDAVAGHSVGEWSGMIAAGVLEPAVVFELIGTLVPGSLKVPGVVFAAAGCGVEQAAEAMQGLERIAVSHDNCPHQILLCGREESVDVALQRLMTRGVLCQKLPFRSGFHSPLFADYVEPNRGRFDELEYRAPALPLWSATTASPYPAASRDIAALTVEHLVRPVRFREVLEGLYADGVRMFVQVGTGRLVGFVSDTIHGRPHAALSANEPSRPGLAQLSRVAGALWAEGGNPRFERLPGPAPRVGRDGVPSNSTIPLRLGAPLTRVRRGLEPDRTPGAEVPADPARTADPLMLEFEASMRALDTTQREVQRAWSKKSAPVSAPAARKTSRKRIFSLERHPELIDHCFYRQPEGWPILADRFPVMPMTGTIELMMQLAREHVPDRVAVSVERVRAYRWIVVEPAVELTVTTKPVGDDGIEITIEGHASATVRLAPRFPRPPAIRAFDDANAEATPIDAARLYSERWMFHGPGFQGIRTLGTWSPRGIGGVIESLATPGATLDNAGQLYGYWISLQGGEARLAFPSSIDAFRFYGPQPPVGSLLDCHVHILEDSPRSVRADLDVSHDGELWARAEGWVDRRFETGERLWSLLRFPENSSFGELRHGAYCVVHEGWRTPASRDLIARGCLGLTERGDYDAVEPRRQRGWLLERMAVKDAARQFWWARGQGAIFPAQLSVTRTPAGSLAVRGPSGERLQAAVAHDEGLAVARVSGESPGAIALRKIVPRAGTEGLTSAEQRLIPHGSPGEWVTRFRAAREVASVYSAAGTGAADGRIEIRAVDGERVQVGDTWVETRREGRHAVAWTDA